MEKLRKLYRNLEKAHTVKMGWSYFFGRIISKSFFLFKINLLRLNDLALKQRVYLNKNHQYLEKEFSWYFRTPTESKSSIKEDNIPHIIWWCWLQGVENAPDLSKACLNSIKIVFPEYKLNIITQDNLSSYIELPNYIIKKYKAGIIKNANFSDIIRLSLLEKYGGIWIDSTVLCTNDKIKSLVDKNSLFVFKNGLLDGNKDVKLSSWLIASTKNNILIKDTRMLLLNYWEHHNYTESYYIMHLLFTIVTEKYPDLWESIPSYSNVTPHMMSKELNNGYDKERFKQLDNLSSVHKLNNHINYDFDGYTLYKFIIEKYL